jgi:hypothetical protein
MAEHDDDGTYPSTWPFRAAGTIVIAALSWFCLGFGLEDVDKHLPAFYEIFFAGLAVAAVLIVGGGLFNMRRERARTAR